MLAGCGAAAEGAGVPRRGARAWWDARVGSRWPSIAEEVSVPFSGMFDSAVNILTFVEMEPVEDVSLPVPPQRT